MRIAAIELVRARVPLRSPFRTSMGVETERDVVYVRVLGDDVEGWGETVSMVDPVYNHEYTDGVYDVLSKHLIPRLFGLADVTAPAVEVAMADVKGHRMAKTGIEMAVLDAELRIAGMSLARHLGAVRDQVDSGVSVGIMDTIPQLLAAVEGYLDEGYLRIKLKIEPGWDVEPVAAVRQRFGDILLQVDANAAYTLADAQHLRRLDAFDLLLIEQPLPDEDVTGHAALARRIETPICLDESIVSAQSTADAIAIGACSVVNIKPGRVGGYQEARRIHDVCAAHRVPVWCGGMLETGIGRAANVALAALPNFTLPGDTSASRRYFHEDVTAPFELEEGRLTVPTGPGLGVEMIGAVLDRFVVSRETLLPGD